jgi:pSer/pThr/pTyr-binding forkhead associated (FHA) protein
MRLAHAVLTTILLSGWLVFGVLILAGRIEIRQPTDTAAQIPRDKARLIIVRGLRPGWEYAIYEGLNVIGRADEQPVDIDLQPQEPDDRVWSSRQHAAITCQDGVMVIEDLSSSNGTYVNRQRVPPGDKRPLQKDDVIQIGEVHIKVLR